MKKLFLFVSALIVSTSVTMSCKFAKEDNPGDTVAASVFEPYEPKAKPDTASAAIVVSSTKDSVGIYYIGEGSGKAQLQLLSYPSRKDTTLYYKARHVRVKGSAQIGNVIRVGFFHLPSGDSIVNMVEQIKPDVSAPESDKLRKDFHQTQE